MKRTIFISLGIVAVALLATAAELGYRDQRKVTEQTAVSQQDQSTQETLKLQSGQLVVATAESDGYVYYYFDLIKKQLAATRRDVNQTGLSNGGYSVYANSHVQFARNGSSYFYVGDGIGGYDESSPDASTRIYRAPDTLIYQSPGPGRFFEAWRITADGTKLYVVVPTADDTNRDSELFAIDTASGQSAFIAALGTVSTPLFLSADETQLLVGEEKERVEDGYHYSDFYAKIIDLETQKVVETLLRMDRQPSPFPSFTLQSLAFGPKFLKAVSDYRDSGRYTIRTIDVADGHEADVYTLQGKGQANAQWSPDGQKLVFEVRSFGSDIPADQGIVLYDFSTGQPTQLVQTQATFQEGSFRGEARLVPASFDGNSLVYARDDSLYYYDIDQKTSSVIASGVDTFETTLLSASKR